MTRSIIWLHMAILTAVMVSGAAHRLFEALHNRFDVFHLSGGRPHAFRSPSVTITSSSLPRVPLYSRRPAARFRKFLPCGVFGRTSNARAQVIPGSTSNMPGASGFVTADVMTFIPSQWLVPCYQTHTLHLFE